MPGPAGKQVTVEPAAREDAAKARGSLRRKGGPCRAVVEDGGARGNHFVQILATPPFLWIVSSQERNALFFTRILDGLLRLAEDHKYTIVVKMGITSRKRPFLGHFGQSHQLDVPSILRHNTEQEWNTNRR